MRMVDLIAKKRDGKELTTKELTFIIEGFTNETIPDYQVSAWAMAVYFQGLTEKERTDLTMAMVNSGDKIDLSSIEGIKVDKHSTGGVGDTTTLVLGPLVASVGVPVAKMSGRGLGHTGGTIDKLESIPGFNVELKNKEFLKLVNENKFALVAQSGNLTPADKKLYALRDVTATVNSMGLIASSVMSKKIASGADAIVLDVKTGSGAFMETLEESEELAHTMVKIGNSVGRKTIAVITDMSQPLGFAIGNALEVKEAIDTLQGKGPEDLTELSLLLGSYMVYLAKKSNSLNEARDMLLYSIRSGKAIETFKRFLENQGGDSSVVDHPERLPQAKFTFELEAKESGYISEIVANEVGTAAMILGAGRTEKDSVIDLSVGLVLNKKVGDYVKKGESLLTIYSNTEDVNVVKTKLYANIHLSKEIVEKPTLIHKEIE